MTFYISALEIALLTYLLTISVTMSNNAAMQCIGQTIIRPMGLSHVQNMHAVACRCPMSVMKSELLLAVGFFLVISCSLLIAGELCSDISQHTDSFAVRPTDRRVQTVHVPHCGPGISGDCQKTLTN